jgi:hypothetical protein
VVKQVADKSRSGAFSVDLSTYLERSKKEQIGQAYIQNYPWLVPHLGYEWSFDLNYALGKDVLAGDANVKKRVDFDLFSQRYPMRYEVEFDEKFEEMIRSAPAVLQMAIGLFLVSQTNAFASAIVPIRTSMPLKQVKPNL